MRDTFTDETDNATSERSFDRNTREDRTIPKRRGSKHADILLQRLQNTILHDSSPGLVGLISFAPRQGVTTMAINLAIRAADHHYSPALIIDGNFSSTRVSRMYRHTGTGLAECLNGNAALNDCTLETKIDGLSVLGAGKASVTKQLLFDTDLASQFFKIVKHEYRLAVVDLPSINEPSLNESILPLLDGVIMVARYGSRRELLVQMQNRILASGGSILGVVMNGNQDRLPGWVPRFLG